MNSIGQICLGPFQGLSFLSDRRMASVGLAVQSDRQPNRLAFGKSCGVYGELSSPGSSSNDPVWKSTSTDSCMPSLSNRMEVLSDNYPAREA
jgi:hypothetical protein